MTASLRPIRWMIICLLLLLPAYEGLLWSRQASETRRETQTPTKAMDPAQFPARIRQLIEASDLTAAETEARAALARLEAAGQAGTLETAALIDLLVEVLRKSGSPEATSLAERSLRIRESVLGPDDLQVADSQVILADLLSKASVNPKAIKLYEMSLATYEKMLGPDHPDVGKRVRDLAIALKNKGDFASSKPLMERALSIFERAYGPEHPLVAKSLNSMANTLKHLGQYEEAISLTERALRIQEKLSGRDDADVALFLFSLANLHRLTGNYSKARPLYERALRAYEKENDTQSAAYGQVLNSTANLLAETGDLAAARDLYEKALAIFEKERQLDNVAMGVRNLAKIFLQTGDLERSREYYERALATWENMLGTDHPAVANCLIGLAELLRVLGKPAEALPLFERARRIQVTSRGEGHLSVGLTQAAIGAVQLEMGDASLARATAQEAVALLEKSAGPDHFHVATANEDLAHALYQLGDYAAAKERFERALSIREKVYGPAHFELSGTLGDLARVNWANRSDEEAMRAATRAESIAREHFRETAAGLSEREALLFEVLRARGLDLVLSMVAAGRRAGVRSSVETQAFDTVIRGRSMVLDAMANRHRAIFRESSQETTARLQELVDNREKLARLAVSGPEQAHPERYIAQLKEALEAKERTERQLALEGGSTREGDTGLSEVAESLPERTALVAYARYQEIARTPGAPDVPSYMAFLLKPGSRGPLTIPLGAAADVDRMVEAWRREAGTQPEGLVVAVAAEERYRRAGEELRRKVWDPLESELKDVEQAFIVPDGTLSLVSFGSFPVHDGRYLMESGAVLHYLSSERDLVRKESSRSVAGDLLAMGGADFGWKGETRGADRDQRAAVYRSPSPACGGLRSVPFGPLPASQAEVKELSALWSRHGAPARRGTGPRILTLTGAGADEAAFKSEAPRYRILHIATHGFFAQDRCTSLLDSASGSSVSGFSRDEVSRLVGDNPLLLTGLVLAGANRPSGPSPDEEDGYLTAEEIASLDLSGVDWAVLSACQTGLGKVVSGEGVLGLRRAFEVAGARTLIMSLWKVEDDATRTWMRVLYEARLSGLTTAESVRKASLSILDMRRRRGHTTHPFFWAGFVAAGDWR